MALKSGTNGQRTRPVSVHSPGCHGENHLQGFINRGRRAAFCNQ